MKKLDKLIIKAFLGPFFLTYIVVVFILLTQHMLRYFEDLVGKDLGFFVLGQLLFDFGVFLTPVALPLAVLLSSLMTFGNLGEHFELTAIKSAGISLLRALRPIFVFSVLLTIIAFFSNNYFVPKAALNAYSMLWDIKMKKPALDIAPGAFYNGIDGFSIKTRAKGENDKLYGVTIYDHRESNGNKKVTLADSGQMYTFNEGKFLAIELYSGRSYIEGASKGKGGNAKKSSKPESLSRIKFSRTKYVFDLSSFGLGKTNPNLFAKNRIMRNLFELNNDIDCLYYKIEETRYKTQRGIQGYLTYEMKEEMELPEKYEPYRLKLDTANSPKISSDLKKKIKVKKALDYQETKKKTNTIVQNRIALKNTVKSKFLEDAQFSIDTIDAFFAENKDRRRLYEGALSIARQGRNKLEAQNTTLKRYIDDRTVYSFQWHKIMADSMACFIMFLIGAPLGAIIKRGGLGMPVILSIIFFILYYILTMTGKKWGEHGIVNEVMGAWMADVLLLFVGLFFLRQARIDARLFESDFYAVLASKFSKLFNKNKLPKK